MAPHGDILFIIKSQYGSFTKAEKKVAGLILNDPAAVMYMSITDLADACQVGETSVFRFCRDLGLKGYQSFKILLAQSVNKDAAAQLPQSRAIEDEDDAAAIVEKLAALHTEALRETSLLNPPSAFVQAVDWMINASKIHFFGAGSSFITALEGYNRFLKIEPKVSVSMDTHMQTMAAALMQPGDAAVIVSYSGSTRDMADIAQLLQRRGVKVICMTRFAKSPVSAAADLVLLCGAQEGPLQSGGVAARISQLYLIDILYHEYFHRDPARFQHNNELTADAAAAKLY
ncbi:MAG: MurR/RpiR family transcriptional regulator [Oscillospiraceae bacterium]|nr:MurR/RpiR family transcriptional regulator [Oscillospiraceae bacterium]